MGQQHPSYILPGLWQGGSNLNDDPEFFRQNGITHILTTGGTRPTQEVLDAIDCTPERHLDFPASDIPTQNLRMYMAEAAEFLIRARLSGGVVFVHCFYGVSRSSTLTIASLSILLELPITEIYNHLTRNREATKFYWNTAFWSQLKDWEKSKDRKELMKKLKADESLKDAWDSVRRSDLQYMNQVQLELEQEYEENPGFFGACIGGRRISKRDLAADPNAVCAPPNLGNPGASGIDVSPGMRANLSENDHQQPVFPPLAYTQSSITQSSSNSAMTSGDSNSKSPSRNVSSITCSVSNKTGTAINTVSNATGATTNTVSDTTGSSVTIGGGASSSGPKSNGFKGCKKSGRRPNKTNGSQSPKRQGGSGDGYPGRGGDPFSPSERNLPPRDRKPEVTGPESPAHTSSSHA